eukprot:6431593-Pyramimonas_sp.AAC.1
MAIHPRERLALDQGVQGMAPIGDDGVVRLLPQVCGELSPPASTSRRGPPVLKTTALVERQGSNESIWRVRRVELLACGLH